MRTYSMIILVFSILTNIFCQLYSQSNEFKRNLQIRCQPNFNFDNTFQKPNKYDGKIRALNKIVYSFQLHYQHCFIKDFAYRTWFKISNWKHHFSINFPLNDFSPGLPGENKFEIETFNSQRAVYFHGIILSLILTNRIILQPLFKLRLVWLTNECFQIKREHGHLVNDSNFDARMIGNNGGFVEILDESNVHRLIQIASLSNYSCNIFLKINGTSNLIFGASISGGPKMINGGANSVNISVYDEPLKLVTNSQYIDRYIT